MHVLKEYRWNTIASEENIPEDWCKSLMVNVFNVYKGQGDALGKRTTDAISITSQLQQKYMANKK